MRGNDYMISDSAILALSDGDNLTARRSTQSTVRVYFDGTGSYLALA